MNIDFTLAGAVIITGLVVVFVALIGLYLVVLLMGKLFTLTGAGTPKKPAEPVAAPKVAAPAPSAPKQAAVQAPQVQQAAAPQASCTSIQTIPVPAYVEEGISDEIVAVISAAVSSMFDAAGTPGNPEGGFIVRSIRRAREHSAWTQAGLAQNTQPF